nr:lactate dehydrogenase, LDH-A [human, Peptide Partial Mutant, 10 aa] [Homo sapiens]
RNVNIFKFII